ncbi:MAG TPA: trypsin-like peptidase domain-containing protein, partial [Candidatus Paceibacterota bacterium]|nr:trypsin-like peptidase domain-containing protein [Candidatus Paceibacterota bacterium]
AAAATTQKTVVVKDDDLTAQSIAAVQKSIVRIVAAGDDSLITRGVILDSKGSAAVDRSSLTASGATSFEAILPSGDRVPAAMLSASASSSIAFMDIAVGTSTGVAPATLAAPGKLALGQSVIAITGTGSDRVGSGVIASLPSADSPSLIDATVAAATPGALLMTIFGEVIGITTADSAQAGSTYYTLVSTPPAPAAATSTPASS